MTSAVSERAAADRRLEAAAPPGIVLPSEWGDCPRYVAIYEDLLGRNAATPASPTQLEAELCRDLAGHAWRYLRHSNDVAEHLEEVRGGSAEKRVKLARLYDDKRRIREECVHAMRQSREAMDLLLRAPARASNVVPIRRRS